MKWKNKKQEIVERGKSESRLDVHESVILKMYGSDLSKIYRKHTFLTWNEE